MRWQDECAAERLKMVADQLRDRRITDGRVLEAMSAVPRHRFLPPHLRAHAYEDRPLPIGAGQTISQPYIVGLMSAALQLGGVENVLEIGTGSGYQAAVLGMLARTVHTVEQYGVLADRAKGLLDQLAMDNVHVHIGDGSSGWEPGAPYQGILVTAAAPEPPRALFNQLDPEGGRLVIPIGGRGDQRLQVWIRRGSDFQLHSLGLVSFVPLRGLYGWNEEEWHEEADS